MTPSKRLRLMVLTAMAVLAGCGPDAPPLEALLLRDALLSDPAVIAALPEERRRQLAERLEEARRTAPAAEEVPVEPSAGPEQQVAALDSARRAAELDALVVADLRPGAGTLRVGGLGAADPGTEGAAALPPLEGRRAALTLQEEERALAGHAGRLLAALLAQSGAHRLVRVSAWPSGAVAAGDAVYVNASWLVALAALEPPGEGPAYGTARRALDRSDTPYNTHPSVAACVEDVRGRCEQCLGGGTCGGVTLQDFGDMRAECEWLAGEASRPALLCVAGFLSLDHLARCMEAAPAACDTGTITNTVQSIEQLGPFVAESACVQNLDLCIAGRRPTVIGGGGGDGGAEPPPPPPPSEGRSCSGGSCGSCDTTGGSGSCSGGSCGSCSGGSCGSCSGGSCGSCSGGSCGGGSCGGGSTGGGSCGGGGGGSCGGSGGGSCGGSGGSCGGSGGSCGGGSCGSCQVAPTPWEQQAEMALTSAWVFAPLAYLALRRRRS